MDGPSPSAAERQRAQDRLAGVAQLRSRRGDEEVRFSQVADHFVDFVARHPEHEAVVDELGSYLAEVESLDHDHDAPAGSSGA